MSPWLRKSQDSFPRSFLLMTVFPFSLLEGVDRFSITHPFSGFRFCVMNHVSAPKLPSLISITCPVDTRKVHTVPYNELCHHVWDSLTSCKCLALWKCQQMNVSVGHASSVVDMLGAHVNMSCHCWKPRTISAYFHGITHHTQKSKHTSYFKVCHGTGRPSIFNDILMVSTHSCTMTQFTCADYMLISAVPWYYIMSDMLLPYFLKPLCVPVRGRKLKIWYKEHIHSRGTTGMNKDMPLILNNNHASGVTDEVRQITWFYKQRLKHTHFVKPVNLYHEKGRLTDHRMGSITACFLILPGHYKTRKDSSLFKFKAGR